MTLRGRITTTAVLTAALTCAGPVAAADSANPVITHPQPGPVTLAAGSVCAFAVRITFPRADLTRYTWTNADRPVAAVENGTMPAEFTNTTTGRTVRRDLSGTGYYLYPDTNTLILSGTHIAALLGPGDSPPSKLLLSNGSFMSVRSTTVDGAARKTILVPSTQAEDLCVTLATA